MKLILCLSLATATLAAYAQYSLDWWTVGGGGGLSTGGSYTLVGTAGQPDSGLVGQDVYRLQGGFWTMPFAEMPPYPELKVRLESGNKLVFVWPASAAGFTLQQSLSLQNPAWIDIPADPVLQENQYYLQFQIGTTDSRFYRLVRK